MAKKRKLPAQSRGASERSDKKDGQQGVIRTYEDVADSEDEFHINRDKILLEEAPEAKRRRRVQGNDAYLEPSDEEVLPYDDATSDDSDAEAVAPGSRVTQGGNNGLDDSQDEDEEDEEELGGWGSSKKDYYNADAIETEADALEEEAEAKRLQQKRLQKMSEADFGFDEHDWLNADKGADGQDVVTEVLKDVEITEDMTTKERLRILHTRYPEFELLADEYVVLRPRLQQLQIESPLSSVKTRALATYIASLTMYFALLTSMTDDAGQQSTALYNPLELRDHPVMESLLQCREMWNKVKDLRLPKAVGLEEEEVSGLDEPTLRTDTPTEQAAVPSKKTRKELAQEHALTAAIELRNERMRLAEEEAAQVSKLLPKVVKRPKTKKAVEVVEDDSDFGEEDFLSAKALAEKAQKKKSLRFYTSQIAQKSNKRADAGRDAGGDADLPRKERLRDRQARLNAEAEKRGKQLDAYGRGADLDQESDGIGDADTKTTAALRDDADDYYDMITQTASKKKADKADRYAAIAEAKAAGAQVRIVEGEIDQDGKRAIGYVIEKNKGLAPKRKKDVRNPRVKKRKKYEEKKKKLASTRAVYGGGEERGGYGGEKTGIKTGLVKSIKL